jgi:hypothetical protein
VIKYKDDKKEKHQSIEARVPELEKFIDDLSNLNLVGYGYNQDQAREELIEKLNGVVRLLELTTDAFKLEIRHS